MQMAVNFVTIALQNKETGSKVRSSGSLLVLSVEIQKINCPHDFVRIYKYDGLLLKANPPCMKLEIDSVLSALMIYISSL